MKQRRTIVIIGVAAVLLVLAVIGLAVYFLHSLEKEKNRIVTERARDKRWADKEPKQQTEQQKENAARVEEPSTSDNSAAI